MGRLVEDKVNRTLAAAGSIPVGSLGSSAVVDLDSLVADKASLKVQRKQIVVLGGSVASYTYLRADTVARVAVDSTTSPKTCKLSCL